MIWVSRNKHIPALGHGTTFEIYFNSYHTGINPFLFYCRGIHLTLKTLLTRNLDSKQFVQILNLFLQYYLLFLKTMTTTTKQDVFLKSFSFFLYFINVALSRKVTLLWYYAQFSLALLSIESFVRVILVVNGKKCRNTHDSSRRQSF